VRGRYVVYSVTDVAVATGVYFIATAPCWATVTRSSTHIVGPNIVGPIFRILKISL